MAPKFKQGDYAGGIVAGSDAILSVLGHQQHAAQQQQVREHSATGGLMLFIILFALFPLIATIFSRGKGGPGGGSGSGGSGGSGWLWLGALAMLGSFGGGGFGGGGLGGGGFGGFSGGGGSFGGGGASGGW